MSITFSKDAAKAVIIAMENSGLDSLKFALQLGVQEEDGSITMEFISIMHNRELRYKNHHGLNVNYDQRLPNGVIIDYGNIDGRHGLMFVKEKNNGIKSNGKCDK